MLVRRNGQSAESCLYHLREGCIAKVFLSMASRSSTIQKIQTKCYQLWNSVSDQMSTSSNRIRTQTLGHESADGVDADGE